MSLDAISAPVPSTSPWRDTPPPRNTWVWMRDQADSSEQLVRTCAQGCCVYCPGSGNLILGELWRVATIDEILAIEAEMSTYPSYLASNDDLSDLYQK